MTLEQAAYFAFISVSYNKGYTVEEAVEDWSDKDIQHKWIQQAKDFFEMSWPQKP